MGANGAKIKPKQEWLKFLDPCTEQSAKLGFALPYRGNQRF
jgi:hypothetical protein